MEGKKEKEQEENQGVDKVNTEEVKYGFKNENDISASKDNRRNIDFIIEENARLLKSIAENKQKFHQSKWWKDVQSK